ncbi:Alpha/Beta hydrolase protein [Phyllosticta paracitricarpa]|uniref:Alpha/Beta hydrolase protein n=1 Tax=Phyllosticta paracitricarpa TaxID=2016321 RepID=A0ABR1N0X1_9PEZI
MFAGFQRFLSQPLDVQWRAALVKLPRAAPDWVLRYTSDPPIPFVINLPSRGSYNIPVYVFLPPEPTQEACPVIIEFHGGGFVLGSCLEEAPFCSLMSRKLSAVVISVDYRMGPVDKFPAALEDAEDVLSAILDPTSHAYEPLRTGISENAKASGNIPITLDTDRLSIAGFSSGGNLALNLALSIKPPQLEEPWPSRIPSDYPNKIPLLLYYPSFDLRQKPSERTRPPKMPVPNGFWHSSFEVLAPTYCTREQTAHPRASPGLANLRDGGLHDKVRMYLVLPELDNLSEQIEVWVKKVNAEGRGTDLKVERYEGLTHGWAQMPVSWLNEEEKRTRIETFETAVRFVRDTWEGKEVEASALGTV